MKRIALWLLSVAVVAALFLYLITSLLLQGGEVDDDAARPEGAPAAEAGPPESESFDFPEEIAELIQSDTLGDAGDGPAGLVAVARALDKVTARSTELELPIGTPVRFGTLVITARACRSRPPEEPPETFAFLEIDDVPPDRPDNAKGVRVFTGWMMASSPALNALEHPVYDVWVLSCRTVAPEADDPSE